MNLLLGFFVFYPGESFDSLFSFFNYCILLLLVLWRWLLFKELCFIWVVLSSLDLGSLVYWICVLGLFLLNCKQLKFLVSFLAFFLLLRFRSVLFKELVFFSLLHFFFGRQLLTNCLMMIFSLTQSTDSHTEKKKEKI